ncbi:MAG: decaprenyl-phosphate phosphoribosyltransferase [Phycisphaerales bacterium]|nr:MAG: decaprenyl-phosphate phosphoribosyltransferase [Phycisphaerales bacterium]
MESGESMVSSESASREGTEFCVGDYLELLRPSQWVKNVVVFAGPAAALKILEPAAFARSAYAFLAFCLAASATYAINDTLDRKADARHPTKCMRPVARGAISPTAATFLAAMLLVLSLLIAYVSVNAAVAGIVAAYFVLTLTYSLALKQRILLDVIIIATGFVLRAWAGSAAVGVPTSQWLVACMFTLCLFLGFGKRRCEITMIGNAEEAGKHRKILLRYTPDLLNHLISVSAGIAILAFLLYTLDKTHTSPFRKDLLFYTLPIVVYGVFRYAMLTETGAYSGPTAIILKDTGMRISIGLWAVAALVIAYETPLRRVFGF